jgi:mannose/cellobiose epimerase-like protein (N-acyl-D-glucosamine 2-epimerase family)
MPPVSVAEIHRFGRRFTPRAARGLARRTLELGERLCQDVHVSLSRLSRVVFPGVRPERRPYQGAAGPAVDRLPEILRKVESSLADNILPFWTRNTWDEDSGGFITHLDRTGNRLGPTDKYLVMQARMIWALAAAHRHGLAHRGYLELAGKGVRFLTDRMWDVEHSGFFWRVGRDGQPVDARKITYGHAFAIYGLAEFAMASADPGALGWAETVFDVLYEKADDGELGVREEFARDWTVSPANGRERKTVNTHLHLLEGLTTLAKASGKGRHAAALRKTLKVLLAKGLHLRDRCALDCPFDRAWRLRSRLERKIVTSYGHNVELAWLILEAVDTLGEPRATVREIVLGLIDHALTYGFDRTHGGVARYGPSAGSAVGAVYLDRERLTKRWWEQAEMLVATIEAYRWTGETKYLAAFEKQFDWVWTYQTDHDGGDWFEATTWDGRPLILSKGHEWKCPYHSARALIRVSEALRAMGVRPE